MVKAILGGSFELDSIVYSRWALSGDEESGRSDVPPSSRARKLFGCGVLLIAIIAIVCGGPRACNYLYAENVKSEFRSHRAYYESLIRQVRSELPEEGSAAYVLPENRYSGTLRRLDLANLHHKKELYDAIMEGRSISAVNRNGVLMVTIAMHVRRGFLGLPDGYGVVYCSGELPSAGVGERLERLEDRWWFRILDMAK